MLGLARALHAYGTTAHRLESALDMVARRLGLEGQFFSTPTAVFASVGAAGGEQHTVLIRVEPGEVDLGKLARLDRVTGELMRGEIGTGEAERRVGEIVEGSPTYGHWLTILSFAVASATAARVFGGGGVVVAAGAGVGLLIGLLARWGGAHPAFARVFDPVAAALASALATAAAALVVPFSVYTVTLAGLIVLVPGLTLTLAMAELATRNLASGSARLAGALVVFLTIAFGVAFGSQAVGLLVGMPVAVQPVPLPGWTELVALLVAPLAFAVLFRAEPRDVPWIVLAGIVAYGGVRFGGSISPSLGPFVGATAVAAGSNLFARWLDRPAAVTLVPGIVLLVPGSIGYRSLASLLERDVVSGVETAFQMTLVATALVTGLLVANVLVPPRKAL